jgi:hypothetical protein
MPDDQPGPPGGGDREDRPGERPTEPLGTPPPSPAGPPPASPPPAGQSWPQPPPQPPAPQEYGQPGYGRQQGYPPPYGGQPGYGQQPPYGAPPGYGYGYPPGPQNDSSATAALVIAVVGFFICPPVGAIIALVLANSAQKRIEASNGQLGGLEMARAARIIAIIELVLTAVLILVGLLVAFASLGARY